MYAARLRALVQLPAEDITQNPPEDDQNEDGIDYCRVAECRMEPWNSGPQHGCACQQGEVWNHGHQQCIEPERCSDVSVEQGMESPLRTAPRASYSCELQKYALGKQSAGLGTECCIDIKKQPCRQKGRHEQDCSSCAVFLHYRGYGYAATAAITTKMTYSNMPTRPQIRAIWLHFLASLLAMTAPS